MTHDTLCPKCQSENTYPDQNLLICAECFHEWDPTQISTPEESSDKPMQVLDCNGNPLATGDSVSVIKDLKVKGSPTGIKSGTKVKNIRLVDGDDGHNIACKIDGFGSMFLKSEFVKKV